MSLNDQLQARFKKRAEGGATAAKPAVPPPKPAPQPAQQAQPFQKVVLKKVETGKPTGASKPPPQEKKPQSDFERVMAERRKKYGG